MFESVRLGEWYLIILRMLNLCQKVNVHLVQNHYHYYKESKNTVPPPRASSKLKTSPIGPATTSIQTPQQMAPQMPPKPPRSLNNNPQQGQQSALKTYQPYLWELLHSEHVDNSKHEHELRKPEIPYETRIPALRVKRKGLQIMKIKQKPVKGFPPEQQIPSLEVNLFPSHMEETKFSNTRLLNPKDKAYYMHEATTIHNLNSKKQSLASSSSGKCSHSFEYSRSMSSRRSSLQHVHSRNNEVYSSSMVLSQLLSGEIYSPSNATKKHKTTLFYDPDRHTIVSKENQEPEGASERSMKIQQSVICEHETKKNFAIITTYTMKKTEQILQLGREINIGCVVSIKEIGMGQMGDIALETQIYSMIRHNKQENDGFQYLLNLYQVQISKHSYFLIKEPFSSSLSEYLRKSQSVSQRKTIVEELQTNITALLRGLEKIGVFPERLIEHEDIVECFTVLKLHNASLLRQMETPRFSLAEILTNLTKDII